MENILKRKISVHQTVKESCERYRLHILFRNCKTFFYLLLNSFWAVLFNLFPVRLKLIANTYEMDIRVKLLISLTCRGTEKLFNNLGFVAPLKLFLASSLLSWKFAKRCFEGKIFVAFFVVCSKLLKSLEFQDYYERITNSMLSPDYRRMNRSFKSF